MPGFYPISLNIKNRKCLVVGGGQVALRKCVSLLEYGADLSLLSPVIISELLEMVQEGKIKYWQDNYKKEYLEGFFMVFGATDNYETNLKIYTDCAEKGILVNIADNPNLCSFIVPAVLRRGSLQIAVSTEGKSPLLAKKIKDQLNDLFPVEYGEILEVLGETRKKILNNVQDPVERGILLSALLDKKVLDFLKEGNYDLAKERIKNVYLNGGGQS